MAKLNHQMIHIICEVVIFICLIFYFTSKNRKLYRHIQELTHRIEEHEETIQNLLADVKKLKESKSVKFQKPVKSNEEQLLRQELFLRQQEINRRNIQNQQNTDISQPQSKIQSQMQPEQPQTGHQQPEQPQTRPQQPEQPQTRPQQPQQATPQLEQPPQPENTHTPNSESDDGHGTGESMLNEDDLDRELQDELRDLE